jgi:hypothetical protein
LPPREMQQKYRKMCCKSQDISIGIKRLGKIRSQFGSEIAPEQRKSARRLTWSRRTSTSKSNQSLSEGEATWRCG